MPKTALEKVQALFRWGHFFNPDFPDTQNVTESDLTKLKLSDEVVRQAIASWQGFDETFSIMAAAVHNREIQPDGIIGDCTNALFESGRCDCPDYGPDAGIQPWDDDVEMALGRGHWKNCHGATNHHKAVGRCTATRPLGHLGNSHQGRRVVDHILDGVRWGYGQIGLEWVWDWDRKVSQYQTEVRFGRWAGGWIGLAQVPSIGLSCTAAPLWAQHQTSFRSGSTAETVIAWWQILVMHELMHNCGLGHTRGGIGNPSILLKQNTWMGDPHERTMRSLFGGEPVPGWPNFDGTDTPPGEILTWENIRHPLTFPDGSTEYYDIVMRGPRMPAAGYGSSNWLWNKGVGEPIRMQILLQPRMDEANLGRPLKAA